MNIIVSINLAEGDVMEKTPAEIADGVLHAVGGDESKDFVQVTIQQPAESGSAGTSSVPPPPPEE